MAGASGSIGEVDGRRGPRHASATRSRRSPERSPRPPARDVAGVVVAADPAAAAAELAAYLPRVLAVAEPAAATTRGAMIAAERLAGLIENGNGAAYVFVGAGPDGRDVAGALSALTGWGVLVNADGGHVGGRRPERRDERLRRQADHHERVHRAATGS